MAAYNIAESPDDELRLLFDSGHGLLVFETHEEGRAVHTIRAAAAKCDRDCFIWSRMRGLIALDSRAGDGGGAAGAGVSGAIEPEHTIDPVKAMIRLDSFDRPWVAIFTDVNDDLKEPRVARSMRELAERGERRRTSLCLVGPVLNLPISLERLAAPFPVPLPDSIMLERIVRRTFKKVKEERGDISAELTRESLDRITESLIGLTCDEAERLISLVIHRDGRLDAHDVDEIREQKRRRISHQGQLEIVPIEDDLGNLGGLDRLKQWLRQRQAYSSERAAEFGLTPPKGVLLLGVPGCGKSLSARLIAGEWRRPLLRMDMGALYNRFVGASEQNLRESLRQADAMAPCILWIDEIEKAFASGGADSNDGGVSQRLFATFLWWMNDRRSDVFIVATANDVARLPPELMRKGRFDEIFFVDLPPAAARSQIIDIHLRKRNQSLDRFKFELPALVNLTDGFSGAEIEQAIIGALYRAFDADQSLTANHLIQELKSTRPMAVTMAERIGALRRWAADRCVSAH